eukprot:2057670-Amphidinium_carterae.1
MITGFCNKKSDNANNNNTDIKSKSDNNRNKMRNAMNSKTAQFTTNQCCTPHVMKSLLSYEYGARALSCTSTHAHKPMPGDKSTYGTRIRKGKTLE